MKIDIDEFANETSTFEPLPAGWYPVRVTDVEKTLSSKGDDIEIVHFTTENGRRLRHYIATYLERSDPKKFETVEKIAGQIGKACGLTGQVETKDFIGRSLEVRVEIDGSYNKVKSFRRSVQSPPQATNSAPKGAAPWAQ